MNITALQFGIYRDGDNNLDTVQSPVIDQAFRVSAEDDRIAFNVEDTTARRDLIQSGGSRTETYDIRDGQIASEPHNVFRSLIETRRTRSRTRTKILARQDST
jgi:hypothetical protein